jgi:hypothetical protein
LHTTRSARRRSLITAAAAESSPGTMAATEESSIHPWRRRVGGDCGGIGFAISVAAVEGLTISPTRRLPGATTARSSRLVVTSSRRHADISATIVSVARSGNDRIGLGLTLPTTSSRTTCRRSRIVGYRRQRGHLCHGEPCADDQTESVVGHHGRGRQAGAGESNVHWRPHRGLRRFVGVHRDGPRCPKAAVPRPPPSRRRPRPPSDPLRSRR